MPAHARARCRWRRRRCLRLRRCQAGLGFGTGTGFSAIRIRTAPPTAVAAVGRPTVAVVGSNHCNGSDRTIATIRWVRTSWPLPERYK